MCKMTSGRGHRGGEGCIAGSGEHRVIVRMQKICLDLRLDFSLLLTLPHPLIQCNESGRKSRPRFFFQLVHGLRRKSSVHVIRRTEMMMMEIKLTERIIRSLDLMTLILG
jgi:hypothetical protein